MTIIRSRLKSPDYIFSKDQVPFLKVLGICLYLKRSLMPFIEGYNTLLKGYMFSIEVRCLCLWVKCYYWRSYTVIFIEGHANHKQVNQTPLKVRFSLFEGALLFIMDYFIFFSWENVSWIIVNLRSSKIHFCFSFLEMFLRKNAGSN